MRSQLKRNSVVNIYIDPITKKNLEGKAKLIKQISYDPQVERWVVQFPDNPQKVIRVIFP